MNKQILSSAILAASLALTACGGDSSSSNTTDEQGPSDGGIPTATQLVIDASAGGSGASDSDPENKFSYFNFASGTVVELQDSEAEASNAWDIAFKRNKIIVNANTAKAALVASQDDFYDEAGKAINTSFINATAASEAQSFIDITTEGISEVEFKADAAKPALGSDWYIYNPQNHSVSANTDNFFLLQNAEQDNVSIFTVKNITTATSGRAAASYTVELFNNEASQGEDFIFPQAGIEFVADFTSKNQICYDLDTQAELDCASNEGTWDVRFDASFEIWLNGGIHGNGAAATTAAASFADISAKTEVLSYELARDTMSGTFTDSDSTWWAYGINGGHNIWSNFRVYAVDTADGQYKLRILSYYAPQTSTTPAPGTSGVITVEFEKL